MKYLASRTCRVLVALLVLGSLAAPAAWADDPAPPGIQMSHYVVALVYAGPQWKPADTEEIRELEAAHLANIFRLRAEGDMLVSGPFVEPSNDEPVGMFVFAVKTVEEAQALLKTDPAIEAGHFRAELMPWMTPSPLGPGAS